MFPVRHQAEFTGNKLRGRLLMRVPVSNERAYSASRQKYTVGLESLVFVVPVQGPQFTKVRAIGRQVLHCWR